MPEKPTARKVTEQEEQRPNLKIDLQSEPHSLPDKLLSAEELYRRRKAEVTQQDYDEFLEYLKEKSERDEQKNTRQSGGEQTGRPTAGPPEAASPKVNRRNFLTVVAGTAAVGEAAALAYTIKNQDVPAHGAK